MAKQSSTETLFLRRALATINCICKMNLTDLFQANFYFKVALQPYISVVSSFFQEATGIDLASSIVLCFFQTSTYSHPFFHRYWVIWRHHLQPSIFSMIVSLFHGSTWSNPHVKETVFISQYFLQRSIIINGLRLIREKIEEYVYLRKTIVARLF